MKIRKTKETNNQRNNQVLELASLSFTVSPQNVLRKQMIFNLSFSPESHDWYIKGRVFR